MEKLQFSIQVNAPKEKVWDILWSDAGYRAWTAAFSEGSHAKTDWQEGSKVHFLDGSGNGMFSIIDKNITNTQMTFKNLGEVKDGEEIERDWGGALESYYLSGSDGKTDLRVEIDMDEKYKDYFESTFPNALQMVKQLAEQ